MPLYRHFSGSFAYYGVKNGMILQHYPFFNETAFYPSLTLLHILAMIHVFF